nr:MAG TPA: hypothetical protein [Caudoviricetes sp.]
MLFACSWVIHITSIHCIRSIPACHLNTLYTIICKDLFSFFTDVLFASIVHLCDPCSDNSSRTSFTRISCYIDSSTSCRSLQMSDGVDLAMNSTTICRSTMGLVVVAILFNPQAALELTKIWDCCICSKGKNSSMLICDTRSNSHFQATRSRLCISLSHVKVSFDRYLLICHYCSSFPVPFVHDELSHDELLGTHCNV